MADFEEQLLVEYKVTHESLLTATRTRSQLEILVVLAPATFFGVALGLVSPEPLMFFTPVLIVVPVLLRIAGLNRMIRRGQQYLRLFIEPHLDGLNTESRHWEARRGESRVYGRFPSLVGIGHTAIAIALASKYWRDTFLSLLFVSTICGVATVASVVILAKSGASRDFNWESLVPGRESGSEESEDSARQSQEHQETSS